MSMKNRLPCDRRGRRSEFGACFHPLRVLRSKRLRCLWNHHVRNSRFRRLFYDNRSMQTRNMAISDPKIKKKCKRPTREDSFLYNQSIRSPDPLIKQQTSCRKIHFRLGQSTVLVSGSFSTLYKKLDPFPDNTLQM